MFLEERFFGAFVEARVLKDFDPIDFLGAADFLVFDTVERVLELAVEAAAFFPVKTFDFDFDVPNADEADLEADFVVRFAALATFGLRAVFVAMVLSPLVVRPFVFLFSMAESAEST